MEKQTKPVVYEARDGQAITLDFDTIRKYLVNGHPEFTLPKELMFFMGMCKSRGFNPFNKDCYLMKYSQRDPAAIIIARDYKRKLAKAQRDCHGWSYGIIVEREGKIEYSKGLMLKGDTLLGGWFKAQPEGWTEPFELEVNLDAYIKKTKEGNPTAFWKKEKQPSMIAKVAESQGLTACWPGEFGKMYIEEEIGPPDMFKTTEAAAEKEVDAEWEEEKPEAGQDNFQSIHDELISKGATKDDIEVFVNKVANENNLTQIEVQASAVDDRENFIKAVLNAAELKNRMDEGDKEVEGYAGLSDEEKIVEAQAKLEEKRKQEQEGKESGDSLARLTPAEITISQLGKGHPCSSVKNAKDWLKDYQSVEDELPMYEDRAYRDKVLKRKGSVEKFLKDNEPPIEQPLSPGAQEQMKRREDFIDFCFEADKKVAVHGGEDGAPSLLEYALNEANYADLDSITELSFTPFKDLLKSEASRRGVTLSDD